MLKELSKNRILNLLLFVSFLICYLEWASGNAGFLFQLEFSVFSMNATRDTFIHPFILAPLLGQLLLLISVFYPNKKMTFFGIILSSILVLLILLVGILGLSLKIIASTIPFIALSILFLYNSKNKSSIK